MTQRIDTPTGQTSRAEARTWSSVWQASLELSRDSFLNAIFHSVARVGEWATDTALEFGALVSALLTPAVVSAYLIAAWSITAAMGITGDFMVKSGPFSSWIVWTAIAILLQLTASVLRRHVGRN